MAAAPQLFERPRHNLDVMPTITHLSRAREGLLAAWKCCLSFTKSEWRLEDYPLRLRQQSTGSGGTVPPWSAQIIGYWQLCGLGESREAAIADLTSRLELVRSRGPLPRPGTKVPVVFAASSELERHGEFAFEFVERVTGIRPLFMSDESSLADFADGEGLEEFRAKIFAEYGREVRLELDGPLWRVLDAVGAGAA
ncbi:MAG: hypothetical protein IPJ78_17240 [Gemmatimonadetes bacterium]|nr:hypothetical protein [Gemmatimonadota bacterium]